MASVFEKRRIDFTSGNIIAALVRFSIPIVIGELLQNLYNSVDALFVGNFLGHTELAAISECSSIANLLVGFFNGMSAGVISVVAHEVGRGDLERLELTKRTILTVALILGTCLAAIGIILSPQLLFLTGSEGELFVQALIYLRIYLIGLLFTVIYNMLSGILRGMGDSSTPLRILIICCLSNVFMDWFTLKVLGMGIEGVALATIVAQGVSVILAYRAVRAGGRFLPFKFPELYENRGLVSRLFSIGLPSGLQNCLISISNLFIWRYINGFGVVPAAGIGVAMRLDKFVSMPCKSFGLTMTSFVSQNAGAENYKRNREGALKCLLMSIGVTMGLGAIVYIFAENLLALFNSDPEVIAVGAAMMHTIIPTYFLVGIRDSTLGVLRGYGKARVPMVLSLIGMVGVRQIYLALAYSFNPRVQIIFRCYPVAWVATASLLLIYLFVIRKKLHPEEQAK